MQELDTLPGDWTALFDESLFKLSTAMVPEAASLYARLGCKKVPLTLIPPQFEAPLLPLRMAAFPPAIREPPPPPLELFDLDEAFASEGSKLAGLAARCSGEGDIGYFALEAGRLLGLASAEQAAGGAVAAGAVLSEAFAQLVQFKMAGGPLGALLPGSNSGESTQPLANGLDVYGL
jgi:intraflagellar transport protein 52